MKKRWYSLAFLVFASLSLAACSSTEEAAKKIDAKKVELVTEVVDKGEVGSAVILTYPEEINGNKLATSDFSVFAGAKSRTIQAVYTSEEQTAGTPSEKGKYVVLELNPNDANASTLVFDIEKFINTRANLTYTVAQTDEIESAKGTKYAATDALKISEIKTPILDAFKASTFEDGKNKMQYRLFSPEVGENSSEKKPLVVYLHGSGERGEDNEMQLLGTDGPQTFSGMSFQQTTPSYVLAPQVPWDEAREGWFGKGQTEQVKKLIDKVVSENDDIDTSRIYISGVSNGATGTWKMLTENPNFFAAAMPIAGYMYHEGSEFIQVGSARYLAPDKADAAKIKDIPIWTFQAEDDPVNSVQGSLQAVKAIQDAGGKKVQMTEYPSGLVAPNPHASWEKAYNDSQALTWLVSNVK
ncbi:MULTISPECIES: prolyl oligopeptidase family serine peptidase [unclassified Listeria]|uniref:prolyl oligopeptidase family serine peptidase n=1 Tax=unclassified Listeria TaxID=2642072 RepID=UPI000B593286|nr:MULTISPECIES: prolyl oligopeptidase family serine peptidase [unclassified Listeria]